MPYHHTSNFKTPKAAEVEAHRLQRRTGVSIAGFRTVLGKYKPGTTKSEMERAQDADKRRTDMRDGNIVTRIGESTINEEPSYYHKMGWFSAKDGKNYEAEPHDNYHADILKRHNLNPDKHRLVRYWVHKRDNSFGVDWGSSAHKKPLSATELRKVQGFIRNHPQATKRVEVHPSSRHDNSTSMTHDSPKEAINHISKIIAHRMTQKEDVGLYSNSTPAINRKNNWDLDKDYIVSEEGLYSSFKLSPKSAELLHAWAKTQGIDDIVPQDEMHLTMLYSKNNFDGYTPVVKSVFVSPRTYTLKVLGDSNKAALVLSFYSEELENRYKDAKRLGAEFAYPNFVQHVTISYNWDFLKDTSQIELPVFPIILQNETVRPAKNLSEDTQPLSKLAELKSFTKRYGWVLKMTNSKDEMIFSKNGLELFLLPEPTHIKKYKPGLKGFMSGPVDNTWAQWKLVGGDETHYGMTSIELRDTLNSIVR